MSGADEVLFEALQHNSQIQPNSADTKQQLKTHAIETHSGCAEASGTGVELETGAVVGGFIGAG